VTRTDNFTIFYRISVIHWHWPPTEDLGLFWEYLRVLGVAADASR